MNPMKNLTKVICADDTSELFETNFAKTVDNAKNTADNKINKILLIYKA